MAQAGFEPGPWQPIGTAREHCNDRPLGHLAAHLLWEHLDLKIGGDGGAPAANMGNTHKTGRRARDVTVGK